MIAAALFLLLGSSCRTTGPGSWPEIGAGWPVQAAPSEAQTAGRQELARLRDAAAQANADDRRKYHEIESNFKEGDQAKLAAIEKLLYERAEALCKKHDSFFEKYPSDWEERDRAANFLYDQCFAEEALKYWEQAVRIKPNSAEIHNNIAVACSHNGRILEAMDHVRTAVELNPLEPGYHFNLATLYSTSRKEIQEREELTLPDIFWKSQAEYERARELAPDNFDYASNCFQNYIMAKYFQIDNVDGLELAATERCLEIKDLSPHNRSFVLAHLGRVCLRLGRYDDARQWLEQALAASDNPSARNLLRKLDSAEQKTHEPPAEQQK